MSLSICSTYFYDWFIYYYYFNLLNQYNMMKFRHMLFDFCFFFIIEFNYFILMCKNKPLKNVNQIYLYKRNKNWKYSQFIANHICDCCVKLKPLNLSRFQNFQSLNLFLQCSELCNCINLAYKMIYFLFLKYAVYIILFYTHLDGVYLFKIRVEVFK